MEICHIYDLRKGTVVDAQSAMSEEMNGNKEKEHCASFKSLKLISHT